MPIDVNINGEEVSVSVEEDTPLLWVIRDELKLTGTKFGCGMAQCGACTVFVDGEAVRSCVTEVGSLDGAKVSTIEALDSDAGKAVMQAWEELNVAQCGYCQSGQIMQATALLSENPAPSKEDVDAAMYGNLCRCATYVRIRAGVARAAEIMKG